jgi:hypothetical protein
VMRKTSRNHAPNQSLTDIRKYDLPFCDHFRAHKGATLIEEGTGRLCQARYWYLGIFLACATPAPAEAHEALDNPFILVILFYLRGKLR